MCRVYKFDRYFLLVISLVIFGMGPAHTVFTLMNEGRIDWTKLGEGRRALPYWAFALITYPIFIAYVAAFLYPAILSICRGYEFKLSDGSIIAKGVEIKLCNIDDIEYKFPFGNRIWSHKGAIYFNPGFSSQGIRELREILPKIG